RRTIRQKTCRLIRKTCSSACFWFIIKIGSLSQHHRKIVCMDFFPGSYLNDISNILLKRNETIAVAESVTSGLMQVAFSSAQGAIGFYQGGITAYNIAQKYKHLNVEPIYALACN